MTITPDRGWFALDLGDLWRHRELILLFVRRDFVAFYKQTVLGPLWYVIQPTLTTVMFVIIFSKIARLPTEGAPSFLFYLSGIVAWTYFAGCVNKSSDTFGGNAHIFGKVYFPRLIAPISIAVSNLIAFSIQLGLLFLVIIFASLWVSPVRPTWWILSLPLIVLQMALLGLGVGIVVSAFTTRYRDLNYLVSFGLQLWMYATPIIYPISLIPEKWRWAFLLNPMAGPIGLFRYALLGVGDVEYWLLASSAVTTAIVAAAGVLVFSRAEKTFMDTI